MGPRRASLRRRLPISKGLPVIGDELDELRERIAVLEAQVSDLLQAADIKGQGSRPRGLIEASHQNFMAQIRERAARKKEADQ